MSAGYDAEVADLFRDLRAASNLTEADLASRIATPVEVVQALEQGAIYALPPWPETCRVVSAYGTLLNLDTRPLLSRIYAQLQAGVVELGPKPVQDVPVMVPPSGGTAASAPAAAAPQGQPVPQGAPGAPGTPGWSNGTPQPQAVPQAAAQVAPQAAQPAPAWPNGQAGAPQPHAAQPQMAQPQAPQPQPAPPQPQAAQPQAPQPQASQPQVPQPQAAAPQPQASQPQMAPQPQAPQPAAWPGATQGGPNPFDLAWPGGASAGQPGAPAPQPAAAPPQAEAGFPDASFPDAGFPGEPQPYPQQQGYAPDPNAVPEAELAEAAMPVDDASFEGEAELEFVEEPEEKSSKSPLLKWGIVGLLAVVLLLGLWMALGGSSGDTGFSSGFDTSDPVLDPDDPRSRKADRLPNNF